MRWPASSTLFPYTTLFRSVLVAAALNSSGVSLSAPGSRLRIASRAEASSTTLFISRGLVPRSEEHTSELQSRVDLVCRLLLENKKASACADAYRSDLTRSG